jgi:FkbH-like protein
MYLSQLVRKRAEEDFAGPRSEFLASMKIRFAIARATEMDLQRAQELTVRTNQLNTTGRTYSYEELQGYVRSSQHDLLICELEDKYGAHGKIGLALVEKSPGCHRLRLFLMSCRVMSLGVGSVFLTHILRRAKKEGCRLVADFRHTGRNRQMYITFKFSNFKDAESSDSGDLFLENDLTVLPPDPPYLDLVLSVAEC